MEDEINIVDYLKVVFKRRKMIVWFFVIAILLGFLQGQMNQSKTYSATVVLLPTSDSGGMFSALSQIPFLGGGGGLGGGANFNIMACLQSKGLARRLVEKKSLLRVFFADLWDKKEQKWKTKLPMRDEDAVMYLQSSTKIMANEGLINITVRYKDPEVAADIANTYPQVLGEFMSEKSITANFRVLDYATTPQFPNSKGTTKKMLLLAFFAIAIGIFYAFVLEYWQKIKKEFLQKIKD